MYNFKKDIKNILTTKEVTLTGINDKQYTFKIDNIFSQAKKKELIQEFIKIIKECNDKNENPDYTVVYEYLIVKYFTDVLSGMKSNTAYDMVIEGIDTLVDMQELGIYSDLILSFDIKEIEKMNNELNNTVQNMQNLLEKYNESVISYGEDSISDNK